MADEKKTGSRMVDVIWVVILSGTGLLLIKGWEKIKAIREAPIRLKSGTEPGKFITVDIPPLFVPINSGDSEESVKDRFTPKVRIDGTDFLITLPEITYNKGGIFVKVQPDPIRVPFSTAIDAANLAIKLAPKVTYVTDPQPGWQLDFPKITLEV